MWVLWGGGLGGQGIKRVEKYQLPLFSKYLPILPAHVDLLLVYLDLNWSKRSVFIESFPWKILRLLFDAFFLFLKMVQKNVGVIVVNLYRDDSLLYLGLINTVGGENVGVATSQRCTPSASDSWPHWWEKGRKIVQNYFSQDSSTKIFLFWTWFLIWKLDWAFVSSKPIYNDSKERVFLRPPYL